MSSMTSSSLFQCSTLSSVNFLQAPSGSLFSQYGATSLTHSSLSMNSQTPSDARTRNLSHSFSVSSKNSGSGITPTVAATKSPTDLLIARPGTFWVFNQTLAGPTGSPFSSLKGSTLPLVLRIRSSSSALSGLWSIERLVDIQTFFPELSGPATDSIWNSPLFCSTIAASSLLLKLPRMALLSPTLAHVRCLPESITVITVVPL